MVDYNIVVRVADDKDFLQPILSCIARLKQDGIDASLTIIGKVYDEAIYKRLVAQAAELNIGERIHFTRHSIRYKDMDDTLRIGFFLNYSLGDVVGYSTMEAMNEGLKTILINCDETIQRGSDMMSFCNTADDLYQLTGILAKDATVATQQIIEENRIFRESFFLNEQEQQLLLSMC